METLDLTPKPRMRTGPREIGLPWSLLLIPILLVAAGLSIPYAMAAAPIQRRRERAFRERLKARGRIIEWSKFLGAFNEQHGSLIKEMYSHKGPVRWWWTPENIYEVSPHSMADWTTMWTDLRFRPLPNGAECTIRVLRRVRLFSYGRMEFPEPTFTPYTVG